MEFHTITIPGYKTLELEHLVLDYNGTIAKDGLLKEGVASLLERLSKTYQLHVITADTFGTVQSQLSGINITTKVLSSNNHTQEKSEYIYALGAPHCAVIGNGSNDVKMLQIAALGIALLGDEGLSTKTLLQSDLVCKNIIDALELFINEKRLIATIRA